MNAHTHGTPIWKEVIQSLHSVTSHNEHNTQLITRCSRADTKQWRCARVSLYTQGKKIFFQINPPLINNTKLHSVKYYPLRRSLYSLCQLSHYQVQRIQGVSLQNALGKKSYHAHAEGCLAPMSHICTRAELPHHHFTRQFHPSYPEQLWHL